MLTKNEINFVRTLARERAARLAEGLFVAESPKLISDLSAAGLSIHQLYSTTDNCSPSQMERMSSLRTPTSTLALFKIPTLAPEPSSLVIALDSIQDPGNLGTIIRTADWFGINTIYCSPDTVDTFTPKVVQATMGSIARVRVVYTPLPDLLATYPHPIYGTFLLNSSNIFQATIPAPAILVMGNEGNGISPAIERLITHRLHIPRSGGGESLNVATATAIAIAQIIK